MYSYADLTNEIEDAVERMESESRLHPDWVTHAVIQNHPNLEGQDSDFYTTMARAHVRDQVRKRLNKFKAKPDKETDNQLVLEGFERLQKRYLITEDGEQVAIRVQDMSIAQRLAKAEELRAMGAGCYQHADELDRYNLSVAA